MGKTGVRGTFAALVAAVLCGCGSEPDFVTVDGTMLGATLHVVADVKGVSRQRLYAAVMELDREAKASMSIFDPASLLRRLNRNQPDSVGRHIAFTLRLADSISSLSDGRYDVTVKPLVEAWGFAGKEAQENPNVDSLLAFVGRQKVRIENGRLIKDDPRVQLDFNSIAKGYTVDLLAQLVESFGARNYIVDIGGEVRCKGGNRQGNPHRAVGRSLQNLDFEFRGDADDTLSQMYDAIRQYGQVSVGDLWDLMGVSNESTDYNYGWYNLDGAFIKGIPGGYRLMLPRPVPLR